MEKLINKICGCVPNNCKLEQEEKVITKKEVFANQQPQSSTTDKKNQKPWSVFEDVYWI